MLKFWSIAPFLIAPWPGGLQQGPPTPVIRADVEVVNILATVRDRRNRYAVDLSRDDFNVYEDGVKQQIEFFHYEMGDEAQPLTIVLLIDTSGSVKDKLQFEQKAAIEFLSKMLRRNKDLAAVVQFDSEINLVQDFTDDFSILENAIFAIRAGGTTKLYDAIFLTVEELLRHEVGRRVVVVLSDGADTQSQYRDDEAIRVAQEQDVVIYGIGVRGGDDADFGQLKKFATATGGLFFRSKTNINRLRAALDRINEEIRHQFSIGYISSNPVRDGSFRRIEVRVKKGNLKVTHRKGYYTSEPAS